MGQMINRGKELIRICPNNKQKIEYSMNNGKSWSTRFYGTTYGDFNDLSESGKEILLLTTKGMYSSINEGKSWSRRS